MESAKQQMALCLWFDDQAEAAADYYTSLFPNSCIKRVSRYGKAGFEFHKKPEGMAMAVDFELNGLNFIALNGGPHFTLNEAASVVVYCDSQQEIDDYWHKLSLEGEEGPCGWLKDKFGLSWQIVPAVLPKMVTDSDPKKSQSVVQAYLQMKKFDIATLIEAYENA